MQNTEMFNKYWLDKRCHFKSNPKFKSDYFSTNIGCYKPGPGKAKHPKRMNWAYSSVGSNGE